jgi:hypothetical protein
MAHEEIRLFKVLGLSGDDPHAPGSDNGMLVRLILDLVTGTACGIHGFWAPIPE